MSKQKMIIVKMLEIFLLKFYDEYKCSKEQLLLELEIFLDILNVTFDQFNTPLLNKKY